MLSFRFPIAVAVTLVLALPSAASTQERDGRVLRPGELRFSAGGDVMRADDRVGDDPLAGIPALTAETFGPLRVFQDSLEAFLGVPAPALVGGTPNAEVVSGARSIPISLSLGILPRLEVGATLPVQRSERLLTRFELSGAEIGLNPDVSGNRSVLAAISERAAELGGAAVLPTAGSPAGIALQQRSIQLAGGPLQLPDSAITGREFAANFATDPFLNRVSDWQPGDLEIFARFSILDNLGARYYPSGRGLRYRAAAEAAVRLPTGVAPDTLMLLGIGEPAGVGGFRIGGTGDLFAGQRFWLTAGTAWERIGSSEGLGYPVPFLRPITGGAPVPFTRPATSRLDLYAIPRYRLTRELSLGAVGSAHTTSGGDYELEGERLAFASQNVARAGLVARYTTFPAYEEGTTPAGIEISAGYLATVAGAAESPALGQAFFRIALFPRLWGERRITPPEPD